MNKRPITPIFIRLETSTLLLGALVAVSSIAILVVWFYVVAGWLKLLLIALVVASCVYFSLRDALLKLNNSWKTLEINALGELILTNNKAEVFKPNLSNNTFINPFLIVLLLKTDDLAVLPSNLFKNHQYLAVLPSKLFKNRQYLTVFKWQKAFFKPKLPPLILLNSQNNQQHRKLRVWSRWGKHAEAVSEMDFVET